jgi:putative NADH-flavin reductase
LHRALVDTPDFPAKWKATAEVARVGLQLLRQEEGLDWTMLSPSAMLEDTGRTENSAIAMIDELERPAQSRQRFTVGC